MAKLNFGCGKGIKDGWMNVDIQKAKGIDKSFNFNKFPYPLDENTFDYVLLDNVLEHLDDPRLILNELHRICKTNATIKIIVPYYNCAGAYNDITHKHFFNLTTFDNLIHPYNYYSHNKDKMFKIKSIKAIPTRLGKLIYPRSLRYLISHVLGEIISSIDVEIGVLK